MDQRLANNSSAIKRIRQLRYPVAIRFLPFLIFGLLVPLVAFAGQYELIKGKGVEVCEAYKKNFASFDSSRPMACERQYHPDIKGFASPPWQKLDLKKYLELYRKAEIYLMTGYIPKEEMEEIAKVRAEAAVEQKVELYLLRINLKGDGKLANIMAVRAVTCGPHPYTEKTKKTSLYVLNDSLTDIDYERQEEWSGFYRNSTIILYKGKPYVESYWPEDGWGNLFTKRGNFFVQQIPSSGVQHIPASGYVCEFVYVPPGEKSSKELSK